MTQPTVSVYDAVFQSPEVRAFYGGTDYLNFGYWDDATRTQKEACDNLMEKLLGLLANRRGTILDVACGLGETTRYLGRYFAPPDITAVNLSAEQVKAARDKNPQCRFHVMDAARLEFPDDSFDHVLCVEAAFHFSTREQFLREACRVLKPGGRLVLSDQLIAERVANWQINHIPLENYGDERAYRATVARSGLRILSWEDATEACWKRHFLHIVEVSHRQFIDGKLEESLLRRITDRNYTRAAQREAEGRRYVLVSAEKPA